MIELTTSGENVFFTADPHYGHKNICRGVSSWNDLNGTRNFNTVEEMNKTIVSEINNTVGTNDVFIILGDFAFGGYQNILEFREQINCKEIYYVLGNHDKHIRNNKQLDNDFNSLRAKDLFRVFEYLEIMVEKTHFILFHYPILKWHKKQKGSKHLFGHVHGNETGMTNSFDVGIDNVYKTFGEYRPISYNEVMDIFKTVNNLKTK